MPKVPMDYANTIIYKIVCNDLNITECYVGHTTNFIQRRSKHKTNCVNEKEKHYNYKLYKTIRENGGWANYSMIELEKYNCNDVNEASAKEREYYEKLNSLLNTNNPHRENTEWYFDNKEKIAAQKLEYNEINKEKISAYNQEYREIHKDEMNAHSKKYRENNKEKISAYREINKEKNSIKSKQMFVCECGKETDYSHKSRHFKSKFHNEFFLGKINNLKYKP